MPQRGEGPYAKKTNNRPVPQPIAEVRQDLFTGGDGDDMALDWGIVNAEALRATIARVCLLGGYISFSAPGGGSSVKLAASVAGREGRKWCHNEEQIRTLLLQIFEAAKPPDSGERS